MLGMKKSCWKWSIIFFKSHLHHLTIFYKSAFEFFHVVFSTLASCFNKFWIFYFWLQGNPIQIRWKYLLINYNATTHFSVFIPFTSNKDEKTPKPITKDPEIQHCGKKSHETYMKSLKEDVLKDNQLPTSSPSDNFIPSTSASTNNSTPSTYSSTYSSIDLMIHTDDTWSGCVSHRCLHGFCI